MTIEDLLKKLDTAPADVTFEEVIRLIDENFTYTPTRFTNGKGKDMVVNEAGQNEGSCKIFAFADMFDFNEAATLALFGKYYREDVLGNLKGSDHANIRSFMRHGWDALEFEGQVLHDIEPAIK